ncbi:peroxiredoxin (alkyl hydroperoxide reductase subunit C) [Mucor circinelloides 1006PhL]|uniref:Peroxiredoxin (Alkyl hydroperoxide reductase subunit C) n=1 Tax=Mucor circinelloides f. circinelloides (strain 1006PhL) TaxID=1220926 RepID=S2KAK7_MUCC1|nr:peroxiredoxin (alkyl hydroperoxide reductase subunit C) [Mucor circinelloides 1006PhL]
MLLNSGNGSDTKHISHGSQSVDEVLRLVEAFKFTDEHGEVCPANWQAGAKTIKPDVKQSKEYFSTVN